MSKKLNKKELIEVLTNDYGYSEDDLKENGKVLTNAKLEELIDREKEDEKEVEENKTIYAAKEQRIKDDDLVVVMNGLSGSLTHRSKSTGRIWRFGGFGQTEKIPYSEILSLRNISPKVFTDGWMIILNKQIQKDFGLTEIYKNILTPNNIESVFDREIEDLENFVDGLPKDMKVTFISKAREMYQSNKLDSRRKIEFIEEKFNVSLDDNAPLSDTVY